MKKHMKQTNVRTIIGFVLAIVFLFGSVSTASADGVYGQYGGEEEVGKVAIDKLVRNPSSGEYVDNLGINDPKYVSQNAVFFKIVVQNTGGSTLSKVEVTDYLPAYLEYVSGGTYNISTREVTYTFENVRAGEKRSTVLQTRVVTTDKMPAEKSVLCPVNRVKAQVGENGATDEDTAQLCIEKKVMAVKVPETGDPIGLILGFSALPTLIAGWKLRRKMS